MVEKTEIDFEYINRLEEKLKRLKDPNHPLEPKKILSDLRTKKEEKLFELITGRDLCFEDNFVDIPLTPSYIRRKIAPQTAAINKTELVKLLKADQLQKECDEVQELTEISEKQKID